MTRIAFVERTWLAALNEARDEARRQFPNLSEFEKRAVKDADSLAMRFITQSIQKMRDTKPICEEKSEPDGYVYPTGEPGKPAPKGVSDISVGSTD
jgi:hypothetical protein